GGPPPSARGSPSAGSLGASPSASSVAASPRAGAPRGAASPGGAGPPGRLYSAMHRDGRAGGRARPRAEVVVVAVAVAVTRQQEHDSHAHPLDQPETMQRHLFRYLEARQGGTRARERCGAVAEAIQKYAGEDVDVSIFAMVLRSRLPEQPFLNVDAVQEHVEEKLGELLSQDAGCQASLDAARRGLRALGVPLRDCQDISQDMYEARDHGLVMARLDQVVPGLAAARAAGDQAFRVPFKTFVRTLKLVWAHAYERRLDEFASAFGKLDRDGDGLLGSAEMRELAVKMADVRRSATASTGSDDESQEAEEAAVAALQRARDELLPSLEGRPRATFSQCVSMFKDMIDLRGSLGELQADIAGQDPLAEGAAAAERRQATELGEAALVAAGEAAGEALALPPWSVQQRLGGGGAAPCAASDLHSVDAASVRAGLAHGLPGAGTEQAEQGRARGGAAPPRAARPPGSPPTLLGGGTSDETPSPCSYGGASPGSPGYAAKHGVRSPAWAAEPVQRVDLSQLKKIMRSTRRSKQDRERFLAGGPPQTMEFHLYRHLGAHRGDLVRGVLAAIKEHAGHDVEVNVFGRVLQNRLPEQLLVEIDEVERHAAERLEVLLPRRPDEADEVSSGRGSPSRDVPLGSWLDVARGMYREQDFELAAETLGRAAQEGGERLVPFAQGVRALQAVWSHRRERELERFVAMFHEADEDQDGILGGGEAWALAARMASAPRRLAAGASAAGVYAKLEASHRELLPVLSARPPATLSQCVEVFKDLIDLHCRLHDMEAVEVSAAASKTRAVRLGEQTRQPAAAGKAPQRSSEEIAAATKIQAVHRGKQARKTVAADRAAEGGQSTPSSLMSPQGDGAAAEEGGQSTPSSLMSPREEGGAAGGQAPQRTSEEIAAATKIQAVHRGKQARKAAAADRAAEAAEEAGQSTPSSLMEKRTSEEIAAATKIQAVHRGKQARKTAAGGQGYACSMALRYCETAVQSGDPMGHSVTRAVARRQVRQKALRLPGALRAVLLLAVAACTLAPAAGAGGEEAKWWCDEGSDGSEECHLHEYSFVETCILIVLVCMALLFEAVHHFFKERVSTSYHYGQLQTGTGRRHFNGIHTSAGAGHVPGSSRHLHVEYTTPLWKHWFSRLCAEIMVLGYIAFLIFISREAGLFDALITAFPSEASAIHVPPTSADWLHMVELVHMKLFLGMLIYFMLVSQIVSGSVKTIRAWEEMRILRVAGAARSTLAMRNESRLRGFENTAVKKYGRWRTYFITDVLTWRRKRPSLHTEVLRALALDSLPRVPVGRLHEALEDNFAFSAYLAYSVCSCTTDTVEIHSFTWFAVILVLLTFAALHRLASVVLLDVVPMFIVAAFLVLGALWLLVRSFQVRVDASGRLAMSLSRRNLADEAARGSWALRARSAADGIAERSGAQGTADDGAAQAMHEDSAVYTLRLLQVILFVCAYACARTLGDPADWKSRPDRVVVVCCVFGIVFLLLGSMLPGLVPTFAALMAMPPYVDRQNAGLFLAVLAEHGRPVHDLASRKGGRVPAGGPMLQHQGTGGGSMVHHRTSASPDAVPSMQSPDHQPKARVLLGGSTSIPWLLPHALGSSCASSCLSALDQGQRAADAAWQHRMASQVEDIHRRLLGAAEAATMRPPPARAEEWPAPPDDADAVAPAGEPAALALPPLSGAAAQRPLLAQIAALRRELQRLEVLAAGEELPARRPPPARGDSSENVAALLRAELHASSGDYTTLDSLDYSRRSTFLLKEEEADMIQDLSYRLAGWQGATHMDALIMSIGLALWGQPQLPSPSRLPPGGCRQGPGGGLGMHAKLHTRLPGPRDVERLAAAGVRQSVVSELTDSSSLHGEVSMIVWYRHRLRIVRLRLWLFLEEPFVDLRSSLLSGAMVAVIFASIACSVAYGGGRSGARAAGFAERADFVFNLIFCADLLVRAWAFPLLSNFLRHPRNAIDAASILPFIINEVSALHRRVPSLSFTQWLRSLE
ncbi:unnamed protein product, partial [Prorocentrum cordatum]